MYRGNTNLKIYSATQKQREQRREREKVERERDQWGVEIKKEGRKKERKKK